MIKISVDGAPQPGGSKTAFIHPAILKAKKRWFDGEFWVKTKDLQSMIRVRDANNKAKKWKDLVAAAAKDQLPKEGFDMFDEPLIMMSTFYRRRPRGHVGKTGLTKLGRRTPWPDTKPDALKYLRSTEDALEGIVYRNDSLIVTHYIAKEWAEESESEGVEILIVPASEYSLEFKLARTSPEERKREK